MLEYTAFLDGIHFGCQAKENMFYTSLRRHCEGSGSHPRIQYSLECVFICDIVCLRDYVLMHSLGTAILKGTQRALTYAWHTSAQASLLVFDRRSCHFHTKHRHCVSRKSTQPLCVPMGVLVLK